jgi:hypothetical protein
LQRREEGYITYAEAVPMEVNGMKKMLVGMLLAVFVVGIFAYAQTSGSSGSSTNGNSGTGEAVNDAGIVSGDAYYEQYYNNDGTPVVDNVNDNDDTSTVSNTGSSTFDDTTAVSSRSTTTGSNTGFVSSTSTTPSEWFEMRCRVAQTTATNDAQGQMVLQCYVADTERDALIAAANNGFIPVSNVAMTTGRTGTTSTIGNTDTTTTGNTVTSGSTTSGTTGGSSGTAGTSGTSGTSATTGSSGTSGSGTTSGGVY